MQATMKPDSVKRVFLTGLLLIEAFFSSDVKPKVSTCQQVTNQKEVFSVLEGIDHVD